MPDDDFTDAQLKDGTTLRFKGKLSPDQVRTKVQWYKTKDIREAQAKRSSFSLTTGLPMHDPIAVAKYVGKEFVGGVGDIAKGTVGMLAPPRDEAEWTTFKAAGPGGLLAKRMAQGAVAPLKDLPQVPGAVRDITQSPVGAASLAYAAPRAVGQAAGAWATGKAIEKAPAIARKATGATKIAAQEIAGAGKEPVIAAERARAHAVETQQAKYKGAKETAAKSYAEDVIEHQRKTAEVHAEHQQKLAEAKTQYEKEVKEYTEAEAGKKTEHEVKVRKAQQDWAQKAMAAEKAAEEAQKVSNRAEALARGQQAYTNLVKDNVTNTHQAVLGRLNSRWNTFRQSMEGATVNGPRLYNLIEEAKAKYLRGAPQSLRQFNDLMRETGVQEFEDQPDGGIRAIPGPSEVPFETGRVHYSAIGDRLASGDLPGNVYKALEQVKDGLDKELTNTVKARDPSGRLAEEYGGLKKDWSQYLDDWREKSSPLTKILEARDPADVSRQVLGKASDRLLGTMARYRQAGASPHLALALRRMQAQAESLPKVKPVAAPKKLELPPPPKAGEPPVAREVKPPKFPEEPTLREVEPPKPIAPVSPYQVRLRRLEQYAGRPVGWYDMFPPRLAERLLMKSARVREWVARHPRRELPVRPVPHAPPPPPVFEP